MHLLQCVVSETETALVGSLFQYTLNKDNFFDKYSPGLYVKNGMTISGKISV